jgi:hypothetical protein
MRDTMPSGWLTAAAESGAALSSVWYPIAFVLYAFPLAGASRVCLSGTTHSSCPSGMPKVSGYLYLPS